MLCLIWKAERKLLDQEVAINKMATGKEKNQAIKQLEMDMDAFYAGGSEDVSVYDGVHLVRESERYDQVFQEMREGPDWSCVRDDKLTYEEYLSLMVDKNGAPRFDLENSKYSVYKMAFELFDDDKSGFISEEELSHALRALGQKNVTDNIMTLMKEMDQDKDGLVSFSEFVWAMGSQDTASARSKQWLLRHIEAFHNLYSMVDEDAVGRFGWLNILRLMKLFKFTSTKEEIVAAMKTAGAGIDSRDGSYIGTMSVLVRMVVGEVVSSDITKLVETARECMEVFTLFDDDGGGEISAQEMSMTLMKLFRRRPTAFELRSLIESVDKDGSGFISFAEFAQMMYQKPKSRRMDECLKGIKTPIAHIHAMFNQFCVDARDTNFAPREMGVTECGKIMRCLGEEHSDQYIEDLILQIDTSGQGEVSFGEFANMMTAVKPAPVKKIFMDHMALLQKLFDLFDSSGSGETGDDEISTEEIFYIVERLGKSPSQAEIEHLVALVDYTGDGSIQFAEFVELIAGAATNTQTEIRGRIKQFRDTFALFGLEEGKKEIPIWKFRERMWLFGDETAAMTEMLLGTLEYGDSDNDGNLDFIEFISLMVAKDDLMVSRFRAPVISYWECFELFDKDGDGSIEPEELYKALRTFGMKCSEEEIWRLIGTVDDGDGLLQFGEFVELLAHSRRDVNGNVMGQLAELREAFAMYDTDASGELDVNEIQQALSQMGLIKTLEEVEKMVSLVDEDGTGELGFLEFVKMVSVDEGKDEEKDITAERNELCKRLEKLLEKLPHDRTSDEINQICKIFTEDFKIKSFVDMEAQVLRVVCMHASLKEIYIGDKLQTQGAPAESFFIISRGTMDAFCKRNWLAIEEPLYKTCANGLYTVFDPLCVKLIDVLRTSLIEMPMPGAPGMSMNSRSLQEDMITLRPLTFSWLQQARDTVYGDTSDIRFYEDLLYQGRILTQALKKFMMTISLCRREYFMVRSNMNMEISNSPP